MIYEYLITLDREVELFWSARSRSTGATVLFIVTRYWTLILRVLNMFGFMPDVQSGERSVSIFWLDLFDTDCLCSRGIHHLLHLSADVS